MISASRINERVERSRKLLKEKVTKYLRAMLADGYLPLTEPVRNPLEEFALLAPQVPLLLQTAADETQPEMVRVQAQRDLLRWYQLREQLGEQA